MGSRYNSAREIAFKMDSEGGLAEFFFGYGFTEDDVTEDIPAHVREDISDLLNQGALYDRLESYFNGARENDPVPGDFDYTNPEE